ncbi:MAG: zinc-ribbon domain-containing protein [Deltaproteobacteria bacterium]|nr:zinc-ribbon domain-containing protein [Deltaproteobacteria bacterium]
MILACGQCGTRFQLDERRIPTRGARVRCSKCNNAFFVRPPEVEAETTLQGIVAETVEEAIPAPEPELEGEAPSDLDVTNPGLSEALEPVGEVPPDEWTFNDEHSESPAARGAAKTEAAIDESASLFGDPGSLGNDDPLEALAREVGNSPEPVPVPVQEAPQQETTGPPAAAESELEGLGDPADWDFLEDSVPTPPPEAKIQEPSPPIVKEVPATRRQLVLSPRFKAGLERVAGGFGWVLCLGLILAGLGQTLRTALEPTTVAPLLQASLSGVEVRDLVARNLENLHAGPILIVSGVVAPRRSGPSGLRVQLLDADGQPLEGAVAWAGPALAEWALRELDPRRLRDEQGAGSDDLLYGGAFDAIFSQVPREARGVAVMPAAHAETTAPDDAAIEPVGADSAADPSETDLAIDRAATGRPRPPSPSPSQE